MSTIVEEANSATYFDEQRLHTLSGDNDQCPAAAGHTVENGSQNTGFGRPSAQSQLHNKRDSRL